MERAFKMTQHGMKRVLAGTFPDGWVDGFLALKVFGTDRYVQVTDKENGKPIMELELGNFTNEGIVDLTGLQVRSRFSLGGVSLDEDIDDKFKKAVKYAEDCKREAEKDLYDMLHVLDPKPFWVVWGPISGKPKVKHLTEDEAIKEAERLAKKHPGEEFHALRSISTSTNKKLETILHKG